MRRKKKGLIKAILRRKQSTFFWHSERGRTWGENVLTRKTNGKRDGEED